MDMKEEMMSDAIDDALGDEEDEDERWEMGFKEDDNDDIYDNDASTSFKYS
jgi:hypothetical protein